MKRKIRMRGLACLFSLLALTAVAAGTPTAPNTTLLENQVTGAQGEVLENIITRLTIEQAQYPALTRSEIQRFYQQTPKIIKEAVQPYGYFKADVKAELKQHGNHWTAHYHVDLGTPLKIKSIQLVISGEGNQDANLQQAIKQLPLHKGDVFVSKTYLQAKQFLIEQAVQQSYINAQLQKSLVTIHLSRYQASIILHLDTGPRYFFGPVSFSPTHFNPRFLERFINYKAGEPYDIAKLKELQKRLYDSSYFQEVEVTPDIDKKKHLGVPVQVTLKPTKSKEYLTGIGYGTDTGMRGQLSFKFPHFGHEGQQVKGLIKASGPYSKFILSYSIPGSDPVNSHYTMSASMEQQHEHIGKSTTAAFIISHAKKLENHWERTLSLSLINDRSTLIDHSNIASNLILFPSVNWLKLETDDVLNPKNGYRLGINLLGAPENVVSSMRFLQAQITGKSVRHLSNNNRLVLHGTIGHTQVKDLNRLPLSLRFYTGGSQSIRGYSYKSVGPGRQLIEASAEIQHRIYKNWYAGLFYDAGNTGDKLLLNLKRGLGVSAIWLSPVGAIELSLAKALDASGKPLRIQFNMGPDL